MTDNKMNGIQQTTSVLYLHAQTSLHPGSGTAVGTVDLPIQRERHTHWPLIPSSSIKGVLRDSCRRQIIGQDNKKADLDPTIIAAFGSSSSSKGEENKHHAGALCFTDARLLAFPVRSLKGVFSWTTCPAVLERFRRDLSLTGISLDIKIPSIETNRALCSNEALLIGKNKIVLEEYELELAGNCSDWANYLAEQAIPDEATRPRVKEHFVILSDDDFTHFVRYATEVVARIRLDYERKSVANGALFYEEFLPAETVLYSLVIASSSRQENDINQNALQMMGYLRKTLPQVLQIGGNETIGKGLCMTRLIDGKGA